jgi:integrase
MARRLRSPTLESRATRLRQKVRRKPYFIPVAPGISLGYRRNAGPGSWLVRCADGKGSAWTKGFAVADDIEDADGEHVLDFWAAQNRAKELVRGKGTDANKPITVEEALTDHERDLGVRGGVTAKVRRLRKILPAALLQRPVSMLTVRELRRWRDGQRESGLAPSSVTRGCKTFKAALSHAAAVDPSITNRSAWVVGLQALPDSHRARTNAVLTDDDIRAIVAACWTYADWLGLYIELLAVTGVRPVQAARLLVRDLQSDRVMMPRASKGRGVKRIDRRPLPLPLGLITKLRAAAEGRPADAPLLRRADGNGWSTKRSDYSVPWANALAKAGIAPVVPYALRHSSITRSLQRGVPARIVADAHDTSVSMIEKTYGAFVADHSEAMLRAAQIDLTPPGGDNVVPIGRRS